MHQHVSWWRSFVYSLPPFLIRLLTGLKHVGKVTNDVLPSEVYSHIPATLQEVHRMAFNNGIDVSGEGHPTTGGRHHTIGNEHGEVMTTQQINNRRHSITFRF